MCEFVFVPDAAHVFLLGKHGRAGPAAAVLLTGQTAALACTCSMCTMVSQMGPDGARVGTVQVLMALS